MYIVGFNVSPIIYRVSTCMCIVENSQSSDENNRGILWEFRNRIIEEMRRIISASLFIAQLTKPEIDSTLTALSYKKPFFIPGIADEDVFTTILSIEAG